MILNHYRITLGSSAAPYDYTLATWTSGAALTHAHGIPDALAALTFMFGAVLGFAFGGVTRLVWGSFHFLSVAVAIGAAVLVTYLVESFILAWPLAGFLFTVTYLLVAGAESTIACEWDHRGER